MVDICKLQEERGARRFGTCNQCGIVSLQDKKMRRISLIGVSFCLCKNCYVEFIEKIEEELAEE